MSDRDSLFDALEKLLTAEDELWAAKTYREYMENLPFSQAVAESGLPFPAEGADILERASFGESVYRPSHERLRAATEARAIAMQQARVALEAAKAEKHKMVSSQSVNMGSLLGTTLVATCSCGAKVGVDSWPDHFDKETP